MHRNVFISYLGPHLPTHTSPAWLGPGIGEESSRVHLIYHNQTALCCLHDGGTAPCYKHSRKQSRRARLLPGSV